MWPHPSGDRGQGRYRFVKAVSEPDAKTESFAPPDGWVVNVTHTSSTSQDFVTALSILLRGTVHEKLRWTFNLYDINKDGYINKEVSELGPGVRGSYEEGI